MTVPGGPTERSVRRKVEIGPIKAPAAQAATDTGALRLLQLEAEIRRIGTLRELIFHMANESRAVLEFRQAIVLRRRGGGMRVDAISSLSAFERNAPMVRWIEHLMRALERDRGLGECTAFAADAYPAKGAAEPDYPFSQLMWIPLASKSGKVFAGIVVARERPWSERSMVIGRRLSETYAHAWLALTRGKIATGRPWLGKALGAAFLAALVVAGFVPVPITAIAPVEVVGREIDVIAAPLDGVVAEILIEPNQIVAEGETLVRMEDTEIRNAAEIAERAVDVAAARLEVLTSGAFADAQARRDTAVARANLTLAQAERDLALDRLSRIELVAPSDGLALFASAQEWIGRPVTIGDRIMEITDPADVIYRISLPVDDLIALSEERPVRVFLDSEPLDPRSATLISASYHAVQQGDGILAYELRANDASDAAAPRIGARGSAQILGPDAPLAFVVLRRPIAWLRQTFGL